MKNIFSLIAMTCIALAFVSCNCKEVELPFFDYENINIELGNKWNEGGVHDGQILSIIKVDYEFVAQNHYDFSLFSKAYATSPCPQNGDEGPKYSITDFNLTCNRDYFDSIPTGSSLNNITYIVHNEYNENTQVWEDNFYPLVGNIDKLNSAYRIAIKKNSLDSLSHVFTVQLIKSNNEIVSGSSPEITWL